MREDSTAPKWHTLSTLREDVRSGTLQLAEFAADLNDVRTGDALTVYREPGMFFDRTYPTYRMKGLAGEVLKRLAGKGGRPVLRLQVAYGGGKTHTLITLLHLAERGSVLADHRTVREFTAFAGLNQLSRARVAILPGDKFDVKEGLEVYGPDGRTQRVHTLWGALAFQLAGDIGYARLKSHDEDFIVPAEPLLVDLLQAPIKEDLGALVLVDEAVWYYRGLVNENPRMLGTIKDFYQVLTQAVAKVNRAALVASLIASRIEANDLTGTQCLAALEEVFGRIAEPVEPVAQEDVSEILRRRLFEQVAGDAERRPAVDAVMAALRRLPLREAQRDQVAYDRMMASYPFHPDLLAVLYQKWTQLGRFQRTRGVLRLLAYALRQSEGRDLSTLVGPGSLLLWTQNATANGHGGLSDALNELVEICDESQQWGPILSGELQKAREIQAGLPTLHNREIEQAVVATFLHSQPLGQRAAPSDLLALIAHPAIDPAALDEGLRKWRNISWFLVEDPDAWQLGTTPNLTHMHVQAMNRLAESDIDDELKRRIRSVQGLATADPGVEVHTLPESPRAVSDDVKLHFLVLGPEYAVEPGKPLPGAVEAFFNEKTGPHDPRIYRNNVIALVPEVSRVAGLREQVRRWRGWIGVEQPEFARLLNETQIRQLAKRKQEAANGLPEAVVGAYNILVALDETGRVQARTLRITSVMGGTPFERIKAMLAEDERLLTTTLDPDLILPGSFLGLWATGQVSRRVSDLMAAFGQFPRLPRLLRPEALYDTLVRGVRDGVLVLRLPRSDGSARTWWRIAPDADTLRRPELEVLPAASATLQHLEPELLQPGQLANLWSPPQGPIHLADVRSFFDGSHAPRLETTDILDKAVRIAVQRGDLMARLDGVGILRDVLPEGLLPSDLDLLPAPASLHGTDLTPQNLPEAWNQQQASLKSIADVLARQRGYRVPWTLLREAVDEALRLRLFEHIPNSAAWPSSPAVANEVCFRVVQDIHLKPETVLAALDYTHSSTISLRILKETLEQQVLGREVPEEAFLSTVGTVIDRGLLVETDPQRRLTSAEDPLSVKIRRPTTALLAEAILDPIGLQKLAEHVDQLVLIAPELSFSFRMVLSVEGEKPSAETLEKLNQLLESVKSGWRLL